MMYRTTWPLSSNMKMVLSVNFASFLDIMNKHYVNVLSLRNICCCQINLKNCATKEGRVMRKLLGNKPSEKKPWYKSEYISNNPALPSSNISRIQRNYKRTAILNKLFMRHITDMMATGEVASDIVGRGIQISRHHSEVPERPLPPMRMDVLGLKHDEIMTKVKKSLKKSRAPHRQKPSDHTAVQQDVSVRKEELTKFLTRRQFMQKERKNYSPELDL
ncbi:uncharacterized protein [Periplaneta americana]|uniref:uncharacterized protein isoform X3 n=1 Tax=Periplaneta americana TaxID=6978 RepID=UPI0037E8034D